MPDAPTFQPTLSGDVSVSEEGLAWEGAMKGCSSRSVDVRDGGVPEDCVEGWFDGLGDGDASMDSAACEAASKPCELLASAGSGLLNG